MGSGSVSVGGGCLEDNTLVIYLMTLSFIKNIGALLRTDCCRHNQRRGEVNRFRGCLVGGHTGNESMRIKGKLEIVLL